MRPGSILSFQPSRILVPSTLPPPGTPEFWLDGFDIDGSRNATLTPGATFSTWKNKGSLVGLDPTTMIGKANPKYYVGANIKGATFETAVQRSLGIPAIQRVYPFTISLVVKTPVTWTSFSNNPIGSYTVGGLPSPTISIRPGFVSFIGETWQGNNVDNSNTPFGVPITTPGGVRQIPQYNLFSVLTCVFDGAASSFGTDHQSMAFDPLATGIHDFRGLVVGSSDEGIGSQSLDGEIAQVLVYYGNTVTHAQIVAWAESVYGGTAPFAP